jgi:hypothetical protein
MPISNAPLNIMVPHKFRNSGQVCISADPLLRCRRAFTINSSGGSPNEPKSSAWEAVSKTTTIWGRWPTPAGGGDRSLCRGCGEGVAAARHLAGGTRRGFGLFLPAHGPCRRAAR